MELKDYTTEELRNELKRRAAIKREEDSKKPRCRNCKHFVQDSRYKWVTTCGIRTYTRNGRDVHYSVQSSHTCDKFELK